MSLVLAPFQIELNNHSRIELVDELIIKSAKGDEMVHIRDRKVIIKRAYLPLCTVGRQERIRKVFAPLWPPLEEVEIHSPIHDTYYRCQVI